MDIRQLRALVAVSEHGSFSLAAKALLTVQSNISTHISRLERELDVVLVDRATIRLTPEGLRVVERARRIEAEFAALESDLAAMRNVVSGHVRIGMIGTTARWLVPHLLAAMEEHYPLVTITILDATTTSLVLQLIGGQVDAALVNLPVNEPELVTATVFDEDRMLVVPTGHDLARRERISVTDLAGVPLLLPAEGTSFRTELDEDAHAANISLSPQAEIDGMRLLASLAFSGFGAAVLPASAAPGWFGGDWTRVPIEGLRQRSVGIATRRRGLPSAAERALIEQLRAVVSAHAGDQPGVYPSATADHAHRRPK
jgi:LysR family hydrogen peroxide-inducible transcriptional activator